MKKYAYSVEKNKDPSYPTETNKSLKVFLSTLESRDKVQASADPNAAEGKMQILLERLCPMLIKTDRSAKLAAFQLLEK